MPDLLNDAIVTLAELRAMDPLGSAGKYPDALVLETRDAVVQELERACRVSFVRRPYTQTISDHLPMAAVALERTRGPVVTALTVNDTVIAAGTIATLRIGRGGLLTRPHGAFGNTATITYTQGHTACPGRVKRAVKLLTRDWLVEELDGALPARATSWQAGENTYRLVTAGVAGAIFDLPEANAIVKQYRE